MSWTLIEHQALTSSVASVTLGSGGTIPQTYKSLKLIMSLRTDRATSVEAILVRPNNNTTGANYSSRRLYGSGSTAVSDSSSGNVNSILMIAQSANFTANTFTSIETTFPNYSSTSANKPISTDTVSENNATESYQLMNSILWAQTTAITSLVIALDFTSNFVSGSSFSLYGLK